MVWMAITLGMHKPECMVENPDFGDQPSNKEDESLNGNEEGSDIMETREDSPDTESNDADVEETGDDGPENNGEEAKETKSGKGKTDPKICKAVSFISQVDKKEC